MSDSQRFQILKLFDRAVERALWCKGPDVQFVNNCRGKRSGLPVLVGPGENGMIQRARWTVNSLGLPSRARIRQRISAVQTEGVVPARKIGSPPAALDAPHRDALGAGSQFDAFRVRRPDADFTHCASLASNA